MHKTYRLSFLYKLFRAFILLAGIPIISICIINHILVTRTYIRELGESYREKLQIADTILKMWEDEIRKQAFIISMSEQLNALDFEEISSETALDYNYVNSIRQLSSLLEDIVSTNSKYYSISVLYKNSDFMISSDHGLLTNEGGYSYADFMELNEGDNWMIYDPLKFGATGSPEGGPGLLYVTPFMRYVSKARGFIIFNIKENELSDIINGSMGESSARVLVMNQEGKVLSDIYKSNIGKNLDDMPIVDKILNNPSDHGFYTEKIAGIPYYIIYLRSGSNSWYYCSLVSMNELNRRTDTVFVITVTMTISFLLLAVLLSYISALKLNTPVKDLEYRLEDYYLMQLLSGIEEKNNDPNYRKIFPNQNFCCVVISLDHYANLAERYESGHIDGCKREILKSCQEKLSPRLICQGVIRERRNTITLVLNFEDSDISFLEETLRKVQRETLAVCGFSLSAGIGSICSMETVYLSNNAALRALACRLVLGPGSIVRYQEDSLSPAYFYPYEKENIIFNYLRLNSQEKTVSALSCFFDELRKEKDISVDNITQACNQLLDSIIKYLAAMRINSHEIFENELNLYWKLSHFEFIDEIEEFFRETLDKIIQFVQREQGEETKPVKKIMNYIRANYDKKFDLNLLAESVGLSYSHVRRVFTEETGESILNYVYKMKVEAAKKLLRETDTPITTVAAKLGFYNKQSFYRFFEKFEGITPNKYREMEQLKQAETGGGVQIPETGPVP
jgi:AraC-like DNA-binding protein